MREFRQVHGRTGERYWKVWFEAEPGRAPHIVGSEWGAVVDGGRKVHGATKDIPGPKGKVGTKAFMSESENAIFHLDRMVRKKLEEGYVEVGINGRSLDVDPLVINDDPTHLDLDKPLPKRLCFSKPRNRITPQTLSELDEAGSLIHTRKINGMMVIAHIRADGVDLYSRRMENLTNHFPHLVEALQDYPNRSIMLFEAFLGKGNSKKDLLSVQSVMRSKWERALQLQEDSGWMNFYLFRVPFWKGKHLEKDQTNQELLYTIEDAFTDRFLEFDWAALKTPVKRRFLYPIQIFEGCVSSASALADDNGYEGWVSYVRHEKLGAYSYSFHGKPDRPSSCFKLKSSETDDFVAYWDPDGKSGMTHGSWGTGKNMKRVGTLSLYQWTPNKKLIYISEVGSGLTDQLREELADVDIYPIVAEVRYDDRSYVSAGDKTNALQLPRVVRFRDDKAPEECISEDLTEPAT